MAVREDKDSYIPHDASDAAATAHKVELAIGRLESLTMLPCVGVQLLSKLLLPEFSPQAVAEIVESDPALAAKILWLADRESLTVPEGRFSLSSALDRLAGHAVRDAILSVRISQAADLDYGAGTILPRKELLLHSLAVACCAKEISQISPLRIDPQLAYLAGLLHDIGKLALQDAMPKSYARILAEAESAGSCCRVAEQKHLGADHTILGKRLAQKWHFPDQITLAIWLHHSRMAAIQHIVPEADLARVVQLADITARRIGIGRSGSFDPPQAGDEITRAIGISPEQLQIIGRNLSGQVAEKAKALVLELPNAFESYCSVVQATAAGLARENTGLSIDTRRLQSASSHLDFAKSFLQSVSPPASAIEIAESFAVQWQRFYQTGAVCLYLLPQAGSHTVRAAVAERLGQGKTMVLEIPAETPAVPKAIADRFAILNAHDHLDWLFEQVDAEFDLNVTRVLPLLSGGKAIGAIVFELYYPADEKLFEDRFRASACVAGSVLSVVVASDRQQHLAERFAQVISEADVVQLPESGPAERASASEGVLTALAEMAAGAAHELNNPLAVISGRAQLLADAESDQEKKKLLRQIHDKAGEASAVVEDLMSFAEPPSPRPGRTDVKQMLDEAIQLTSRKTNIQHINVQIQIDGGAKSVFVDSAQIVSAIANIVANAIESYSGDLGPIKISAEPAKSGSAVQLTVSDLGRGMDPETLRKAAQPFFSAKPAGRKRGMGLAYAARFIQLNNGSLDIESEPGSGTTVTIRLPCQ